MFKITLETFNYENTANNEVFLVILVHMQENARSISQAKKSHWLNANLKNEGIAFIYCYSLDWFPYDRYDGSYRKFFSDCGDHFVNEAIFFFINNYVEN